MYECTCVRGNDREESDMWSGTPQGRTHVRSGRHNMVGLDRLALSTKYKGQRQDEGRKSQRDGGIGKLLVVCSLELCVHR